MCNKLDFNNDLTFSSVGECLFCVIESVHKIKWVVLSYIKIINIQFFICYSFRIVSVPPNPELAVISQVCPKSIWDKIRFINVSYPMFASINTVTSLWKSSVTYLNDSLKWKYFFCKNLVLPSSKLYTSKQKWKL